MGTSASRSQSQTDLVQAGEFEVLRHPYFRHLRILRTIVGLATSLVIFLAGINSLISVSDVLIGVYLLIIATPIFLLEFGKPIRTVCGTDGACCKIFSLVLGFDKKRRGLLYVLLAIPLFLSFWRSSFSTVAGVLLTVCGILYFVKGWETKKVPAYISSGDSVRTRDSPTEPA